MSSCRWREAPTPNKGRFPPSWDSTEGNHLTRLALPRHIPCEQSKREKLSQRRFPCQRRKRRRNPVVAGAAAAAHAWIPESNGTAKSSAATLAPMAPSPAPSVPVGTPHARRSDRLNGTATDGDGRYESRYEAHVRVSHDENGCPSRAPETPVDVKSGRATERPNTAPSAGRSPSAPESACR